MHPERNHPPPYRPDIDGLRAIAVSGVLLFHLDRAWLPGGFAGVDVFFVISGYLIARILQARMQDGTFAFGAFYRRRAARILPGQIAVICVTLLAASQIYGAQDFASLGANAVAAAVSLTNVKLMLQGGYFDISEDAQPLLHFWSLAAEEQYYLGFPLLLLLLLRRPVQRPILLSVFAVSLGLGVWLTVEAPRAAFFLLPTRAWELLAGALIAVLALDGTAWAERRAAALSGLGLAAILCAFLLLDETTPFPGVAALVPVGGAACLILAGGRGGLVSRLLAHPGPVAIGKLSYALYLWHWPIFSLTDYALFAASPAQRLGLKLGLTAAAAVASYLLIERPARAWFGAPGRGRISAAVFGGLMAALALGGYATRQAWYPVASVSTLAEGGAAFGEGRATRIVLLGDSNAAMYARRLSLMADGLDVQLNVMAMPGDELLPGRPNSRWPAARDALARLRPDLVILAHAWARKTGDDPEAVCAALDALAPLAGHVLVLAQAPNLAPGMSRAAVRDGAPLIVAEPPEFRAQRERVNALLAGMAAPGLSVLDVSPLLMEDARHVRFTLESGRAAFQDAAHLSDDAVATLAPALQAAIEAGLRDGMAPTGCAAGSAMRTRPASPG